MSLFESASLVVTPNGTKASKLYSVKPTDGSGDMTVVRATTATRVNSSGLIESSAVNVPRLDYTGSTCPSLLVEPQRTNLALYSEQFDNAVWTKTRTTVVSNATIAPDGSLTADKLIPSIDNNTHILQQSNISVTAQIYSATVYAKKGEYDTVRLFLSNLWSPNPNAIFNLTTKSIVSTQNGTAKITELTNGWFKLEITSTINAVAGSTGQLLIYGGNNGIVSFAGDGTSGVFIWGAQLEAGANATSYIPTTTASVTRNADFISKTGISSLIGQTEGTLYANINFKNWEASNRVLAIGDGTTYNRIVILEGPVANTFRFLITTGGVIQSDIFSSSFTIGNYKIAAAYKNNDVALYINGSQIGTDNLATIPVCSNLYLGMSEYSVTPTTLILNDSIKSAALWKTRLTNAELATLTTL